MDVAEMTPENSQQVCTRTRVCHVASTTEGATWMLEQLRDLRDHHGHDVTAVVSGTTGSLVDKLREQEIPSQPHDFSFGGLPSLLDLPGRILRLAWYFRRQRFHVVQTHLFNAMVIGRIAAWLADVPVRVTMVAGPFHLEAHTPRWIDKATFWMDSVLVGSCNHTLGLYRGLGVGERRLARIYYGPDESRFSAEGTPPARIREEYGWPESTPLIAMVAYFYPRLPASNWIPQSVQGHAIKGHEYLIHAAPQILAEYPDARIILVGAGWGEAGASYLAEMRALVHQLKLEDRVIFTGFRKDVNNILRASNVAVQASLNENLGGAIEALLMKCPTVATRVGGLVDCVLDGNTGLLVEPRNANDLARGIVELLRDPPRAARLAEAGRQLMLSRFTLSSTVADLDRLYKDRLSHGQRAGYRSWVSVYRLAIAAPLGIYLATRLILEDRQALRCLWLRTTYPIRHRLAVLRSTKPGPVSSISEWITRQKRHFCFRPLSSQVAYRYLRDNFLATPEDGFRTQLCSLTSQTVKRSLCLIRDCAASLRSRRARLGAYLSLRATICKYRFWSFVGRQMIRWHAFKGRLQSLVQGNRKSATSIVCPMFTRASRDRVVLSQVAESEKTAP